MLMAMLEFNSNSGNEFAGNTFLDPNTIIFFFVFLIVRLPFLASFHSFPIVGVCHFLLSGLCVTALVLLFFHVNIDKNSSCLGCQSHWLR